MSKKDSLLFAPLSNVGAVSFDKDAVYINIGNVNYTKKENIAIDDQNGETKEGEVGEKEEESESDDDSDDEAPSSLLRSLQDVQAGVDEKMKNASLRLFKGSKAVRADDDDSYSDEASDNDDDSIADAIDRERSRAEIEKLTLPFRQRHSISNGSDDSDSGSDDSGDDSSSDDDDMSDDESESENGDDGDASEDESESSEIEGEDEKGGSDVGGGSKSASTLWKTNLAKKAAEAYLGRQESYTNLQELIYGRSKSNIVSDDEDDVQGNASGDDGGSDSDSDDDFFKIRKKTSESAPKKSTGGDESLDVPSSHFLTEEDSSRVVNNELPDFDVSVWVADGEGCLLESLRDKFVTGNWGSNAVEDEENEFDDFEDLETGEKFGPNGEIDSDNDDDGDSTAGMTDMQIREHNAKKKTSKKENFDEEYDEEKKGAMNEGADPNDAKAENDYVESLAREKEARLRRNQEEFGEEGEAARIRHEGFRQGLYCRIRIDGIPAEFLEAFNPNMPLVLGGLTPQETNRGYIRCRFKKHRWHKKILKCNDPLIFSVGWRRFQSIPVFSTEDQNGRHRLVRIKQ